MPVRTLVLVHGVGPRTRYIACLNRIGLLRWAMGLGCQACETRSHG